MLQFRCQKIRLGGACDIHSLQSMLDVVASTAASGADFKVLAGILGGTVANKDFCLYGHGV